MSASKRRLMLLSSGDVKGYDYATYWLNDIKAFLFKNNVKTILLICYGFFEHDKFHKRLQKVYSDRNIPFCFRSIHNSQDPISEINAAETIYVGGGNVNLLMKSLHDLHLLEPIKRRVLDGVPYIGLSSGAMIATTGIETGLSSLVVQPPTLEAMGLVPFNITRSVFIRQYFQCGGKNVVLALPDASGVLVEGFRATLIGSQDAKLYKSASDVDKIPSGADISYLLHLEPLTPEQLKERQKQSIESANTDEHVDIFSHL